MQHVTMRVAGENDRPLTRRFNFTVGALKRVAAPPPGKQEWVYDSKTPGLAMLTTANAVRTYYLYRKVQGRPERIKLGRFDEISIENARRMAMERNGQIASGMNPAEMKRVERAAMTFKGLWEWYLENHAKPRNRSWRTDELRYKKYLTGWNNRRLDNIQFDDVQALHSRIGKDHPTGANRVLALVSTMFNRARAIGYSGENPARGVQRFKETQRERFLQADELPRFFEVLDAETTPAVWRDFFKLLLLTGARRGNVLAMRWADVNLARAEWCIPPEAAKAGHAITVPLSAEVVQILKDRQGGDSPWVFPAIGSRSGHVVEPRKAWKRLLTEAKLTNVRIHDLRRTLGSWQAATGASLPVIGKSLGHRHQSTTQIYARLNIDPVRESVVKATAAMFNAGKAPEEPKQENVKGKRKGST